MAAHYRSPNHYLTIIGLRFIGGELRVYRIARQYPFPNQHELVALGGKLHAQYGDRIVYYDGIASNACTAVILQRKRRVGLHPALLSMP